MLQWTDAFQPDRGDGRSDVAFEKAALIFNLGAIASQVCGAADSKTATACTGPGVLFGAAAGPLCCCA